MKAPYSIQKINHALILFSATYLSNIKANFDSLTHIRTEILDRHKFITFIDIRISTLQKIISILFFSLGRVCDCFSFKFENRLSCPLFWCKLDFSSSKNEVFSPFLVQQVHFWHIWQQRAASFQNNLHRCRV